MLKGELREIAAGNSKGGACTEVWKRLCLRERERESCGILAAASYRSKGLEKPVMQGELRDVAAASYRSREALYWRESSGI